MKKFGLIGLTLILGACGGFHKGYASGQLRSAGEREAAAWNTAQAEAVKICPKGTTNKPLPRAKALDSYNCKATLIEKYVRANRLQPH